MLGKYLRSFQTIVYAFMSIFQAPANVVIAIRSVATQTLDVFQSVTNSVMATSAINLKTANRFLTASGGTSSFWHVAAIASPTVGYDWGAKKEPGTGRRIAASAGSGLINRINSTISVMNPTRVTHEPYTV